MKLPPDFEFSQSSLQDYTDCRRRFLLRHIKKVAWPAVQTEPIKEYEEHIRRGQLFHRLAQQYLLGIPSQRLDEIANADPDEHLHQWWQSFTNITASDLKGTRWGELTLATPLAGYRLIARYDLILINPDHHLVIFDWKTSLHRPKRSGLANRMQTRVYPYLLACSGKYLEQDNNFSPDQISMIYWFAAFPNQPEQFNYNHVQFEDDARVITNLANEILGLPEAAFNLTEHIETCAYCVYRSLCDRGISAGSISQLDPEIEISTPDLDLEQVAEISF